MSDRKTQQCEFCESAAKWWMRKDNHVRYCCGLHIKQTANLIRLDLGFASAYTFGPLHPVTGVEEK